MKALRAELDHISETILPQDFLVTLAENIDNLGALAFRDMLYEFVKRQNEPKVQAAVILMGRLASGSPLMVGSTGTAGEQSIKTTGFGILTMLIIVAK